MSRRSLGHVELEWECPKCGARNSGRVAACAGCGAPQPEHVEFTAPAAAQFVTDDATIRRATGGPDVHCPYCNARNPADATICPQCGGDLTAGRARASGQVLGALRNNPAAAITCAVCGNENPASALTCQGCGAPLRPPDPAAASAQPTPAKSGCSWFAVAAALLVAALVGFGIFYFFLGVGESGVATVVEPQWTRTIRVEALSPVTREGWRAQAPENAVILACREEVEATVDEPPQDPSVHVREVCGTPFVVDEGTGFGEAVQECRYEILAEFCSYEALEWRDSDPLQLSGSGFEMQWPEFVPSPTMREASRDQEMRCVFALDGAQLAYRLPNADLFDRCRPGSAWQVELNRTGGVISAQPR